MSLKNVTIVGASGNLGRAILPALIASDLNITVVSRASSTATFPEGVKVVKIDYTLESLTETFKGQDAVLSLIPIMAIADQILALDAAIAAGVKRFVPSEYGSDSSNPAVIAAVPFFEAKAKFLELLKTKQDVISWSAIITGPFFDWGLVQGMLGFSIPAKTALIIDNGTTRTSVSTIAQIAKSVIAVLAHPTETANQVVFVESFTTTQNDILAALEKATGDKFTVTNTTSDELRAEGFKAFSEGDLITGGTKIIGALVFGKGGLEDHTEAGIWNEKLGFKVENLEEEIGKAVAAAK